VRLCFVNSARLGNGARVTIDLCEVGAPLFMPPTLRRRAEDHATAPRRCTRDVPSRPAPHRGYRPSQPTGLDPRRADERRPLDNALLGWVGVAVALSIISFCAMVYARDPAPGESVVTAWVAAVAMTLALGPCVLCAVLAHREVRRSWWPIGAFAIPALLGVYLIMQLG
jgi:hypothetical protein